MRVPNRRPPRPHSWSWSRSPRRQWAAAKPSQVMKPNKRTKTVRATQFSSITHAPAAPPSTGPLGREINDGGRGCASYDQRHLKPVEERNAGPGWLDRIIERHPEGRDEFSQKQEIPPAPLVSTVVVHWSLPGLGTSGSRL